MPLEKLGPYKLEKILGRGGMGTVYIGLNEESGERAAVKVLSAHLSDDASFRDRFKVEIETLKRLLHPNIVQLFGFGEEEGHLFYVMELVTGRSLQDELVAGRRFTWREVARIGIAVAQALKHAHDRGIIHRDLKPANLLIDEHDHVKLADFGIAKLYGGTGVTADGGVLGTADYMAPEQADGKQITSRCDLYSLGSVLHALLAGRPPFAGRSLVEVIASLKNDAPPPIRRLAPDTPAEFENILLQLLEKDPHKRIPTAMALANRLKAMEHALSPDTHIASAAIMDDELRLAAPEPSAAAAARNVSPGKTSADRGPSGITVPLADTDDQDYRIAGEPAPLFPQAEIPGAKLQPPGSRATDISGQRASGSVGGNAGPQPSIAARASHFTTVSEAELRGRSTADEEQGMAHWIKVSLLLAATVAVCGGVLWYATRPPSMDQLYARIKAAGEKGEAEALVEVEPQITQFLATYPTDARAREVEQYRQTVELFRLQRRFELRARRSGGVDGLTPVERAYLQAVQQSLSDPETALTQFQAIIDVFGGPVDTSQDAAERRSHQQCLDLAQKQMEQLKKTVEKMRLEQNAVLLRQLERADRLATDDRASAERIWEGIITLYGDKPWAAEFVSRAEAHLAETEP